MNNNYTDTQLKQALVKMLPDRIKTFSGSNNLLWITGDATYPPYKEVLDSELLHLCWLVEETLDTFQAISYWRELFEKTKSAHHIQAAFQAAHTTWQQKVIALAKVSNIEIL